jgi:hypothetical protein
MKKVIVVVLLAMFVLSGCAKGGSGGSNWNTFIGGTEGISMQFDMDAPPAEVNIGDEFLVMVILTNLGEYTVAPEDYFVRIKGFSPEEFSTSADALVVQGTEVGEPLQANELNPDTGETLTSYPVYVEVPQGSQLSYTGAIAGNTPFPIAAEVCYKYMTTANAKLCIKEDLTKTTDTAICTVSGPQLVTTSGGPVQIANFMEFSGGKDGIRFSFTVTAANTAGAISTRSSSCSNVYNDEDKVYITIDTGIPGLSCNGFIGETSETGSMSSGYVKLSSGSRQVTCRQDLSGNHASDYVKIMTITAEYDYEQSVATTVLIKKVI